MNTLDTSTMSTTSLALAAGGISIVGLYQGFKHGVWAGCCSLALGPNYLEAFSEPPAFVRVLPASLGALSTVLSPASEYPAWFALYGVCYTMGGLIAATFTETPKTLLSFGAGFILLRLLFS